MRKTSSKYGFIMAGWGQIRRIVSQADIILEVLDARDPLSTMSRKLEKIVNELGRDLILVLNKADLVPRSIVEEWVRLFRDRGYHAVYMAASKHMGTRVLRKKIKEVAASLPVVVAVVGFPKTGKSSIINALKGKHSASTSPIPGSPGYTKHAQLYRIDSNILMIDTPGVIPVEGSMLERIIRGMNPDQLEDPVNPAIELIKKIMRHNPTAFIQAYGISEEDPLKILEHIAIKRGWFYKKTHEPLIEEAARTVIRDFHRGKIPYYVPPYSASI
ncbi:MAG: GTPase [Thermoprotei archaeon]